MSVATFWGLRVHSSLDAACWHSFHSICYHRKQPWQKHHSHFPSCSAGCGEYKGFVPESLLSVPRRSLFINIFLPPHLFNITYSAWKYCPFCPLLHHLLTQSSLCLGRIQLAHMGGERIRIFQNCWFGEGQREGCETQKSPCTLIAPQLRSPSLPPAMVPRVINAQPSFHPGLPSPCPDVPAAVAGTMASAECPAQRQQLHSRVRLCSLLEQWQCVTPSRRPAPNNLFIDAISLSVVYLRMSFHKCMEIEIILCFRPKD